MTGERRFYEVPAAGRRRSAPAALRNREAIAAVLAEWLPTRGDVLEIASGTGEHVIHFAERFPALLWQPSDVDPDALASIAASRHAARLANVRTPLVLDAARKEWPTVPDPKVDGIPQTAGHPEDTGFSTVLCIKMNSDRCDQQKTAEKQGFDVVLNLNMVHISPWSAALGLLDGAARVLRRGGALVLYGPWLQTGVETAPSNLAFDEQLRERDPEWGLRRVEDFDAAATERGFGLEQTRAMPANNLMLLFRLAD